MPTEGWVVTQQGHEDLRSCETCRCEPRIVGLLVECRLCGTVYGHLRESLGNMSGRAEYKR